MKVEGQREKPEGAQVGKTGLGTAWGAWMEETGVRGQEQEEMTREANGSVELGAALLESFLTA